MSPSYNHPSYRRRLFCFGLAGAGASSPPPPFWGLHRHAAFVKPATDAQAEWQATRGAHLCSGNGSAYPTATAAARAAAATDDPEDETTKPPYAQRQQLQYRAYALRKWNTVEYGPELFGERS